MRRPRFTHVLTGVAVAIALIGASVAAHAKAFEVACDAQALGDAMAAAAFNDEEDVLWLAPSCVYPLSTIGILLVYADNGFPLTIQGRGATIHGQNLRTAFLVNPGATLYLENLTITECSAGPTASGDGGAIYNAGAVTLTKSTVSKSLARNGGGIFNAAGASLTVIQSTISGNTASDDGGGIMNENARLTLIGSTVSGNTAQESDGLGAGIYSDDHGPGEAVATLINSTFSGNASRFGAGVFNDEGEMVVSYCTFSGNTMLGGGNGASIYYRNYSGLASLKLGGSILANGIAEVGGGYECVRDPSVPEKPITSTGVNLIEDASCVVSGAYNGPPNLGSLTGNPAYHPLLPGSPVIDLAPIASCPGFDQRGASRPKDGNPGGNVLCDLGAYEAP
jgi:hypothetical protein